MRYANLFAFIVLLATTSAFADPIHYDQIPSATTGYFQMDVDGFFSSHLATEQLPGAADISARLKAALGGDLHSVTMYTLGKGGDVSAVVLVHASISADARKKLEDALSMDQDSVVFNYDQQDVHYSKSSLDKILSAAAESLSKSPDSTQPAPRVQGAPKREHFTLGLGAAGNFDDFTHGHAYLTFLAPDLIVAAADLASMATALDVISGKKPSLEKDDPQGMKADVPAGTIVVGSGLSAELTGDDTTPAGHDAATQPVKIVDPAGGFGLDMFGTFKGKARLAGFAAGESGQLEFIDASFAMIDTDSAEQLKNLLVGVKALVSLSNQEYRPLVDPLEVQSAGKSVTLHWSWPTAMLSQLFSIGRHGKKHEPPNSNAPSSPVQ